MTAEAISIGPLETKTLKAIDALGVEKAYGQTVKLQVSRYAKYQYSHGAVYGAIDRLVQKGLVEFVMSRPRNMPGGRARKMCRLTTNGRRILENGGG